MERVIPKDIVDLIYKESHLDKIKRLNAEYHKIYVTTEYGSEIYLRTRAYTLSFGYRELHGNFQMYTNVCAYRNNNIFRVGELPKRYVYSSGHFGLKWIE